MMMKTKVIQYVSRIKDGGAETLLRDYALLLDKSKFDVIVVCEDYKKNSANYKFLKDNKIKCISTYGKFDYTCRAIARIFGARFKAALVKKVIKKINPDVIHIHLESLEVIKLLSNDLKSTKLFFTCANVPDVCIGEKRPKEKEACEYLLKHNNLQILALHQEMADEINKMFNINNVLVFRSGTNFKRFENLNSKEIVRKSIGVPEDCYLIGHIGRFAYQKNHEFLVKVFNEITKIKENARLLLIGSGKLKNEILNQLKDLNLLEKVTIICDRTDTPELLQSMDVFLFPSRFEGLSVSMVEAQVAGVPCIVSNKIAHETYCSKNITELSFDDNLSIWANACIDPKGNIKKWNDISDYDLNKIVLKLQDLYLQ